MKGIIVVFDITNYNSYKVAKDWIDFVKEKRLDNTYSIILCGNKSDLSQKRVVSVDELLEYSNGIKAAYYEISLKTRNNLNEMKTYILNKFPLDHQFKKEVPKSYSCYII